MNHLKKRVAVTIGFLTIGLILLWVLSVFGNRIVLELNPTRRRVQELLGMTLPESVDDVRYYKYQPNSEITYYTVYIRFRIPKDEYMDLMRQMNMTFYTGVDTPYWYLFPGKWKTSRSAVSDWWNPTLETLRNNTATRQYGSDGWIIAKHENGYAYIRIFVPSEAE